MCSPFLKEHFCSRLKNETFLIFDRTHKAALVWQDRKARIISLDTLELPPATAEELRYRVLWKRFYKTIAIAARENPRCRMTHCPKRYWENMLEMEDELRRTPDSLDALPAAAPALLPTKGGTLWSPIFLPPFAVKTASRYTPPSLRTSQKPFPSLRYGKTAPGFWCATAREKTWELPRRTPGGGRNTAGGRMP